MTSTNLPFQLTSFIGREREIADIMRLVPGAHLVTLTGAGGSGKTRLAIRIANMVSEAFADGVWFVDLAPLSEPELVPQLVVEVLGLRPAPDQPVLESLLNFMQPKQMLLILDNCEHLSAACARFAQQVLSRAPELGILATSREPLGITGERIYPLSGLGWPATNLEAIRKGQGRLDLQELIGFDAIRLFVERARAISPNFNLTSENAQSTVEICRRLDGLPLALELASARVNVLTVEEITARLKDRFSLLISIQPRGLEPRHHTLRAAIDWSYTLLTADEQVLLRRLAVFTAGFTLDMAEAVCCGEEIGERRTLDQISSLVSKSLLIADTIGRAQARYRLLETIREYALEKLEEAGETAALRDRHLERGTRIKHRHPPAQSRRAVQSNRARVPFVEMLVHFKRVRFTVGLTHQRLMQRRQNGAGDIDHRPVHLGDGADRYKILSRSFHHEARLNYSKPESFSLMPPE